MIKLLNWLFWQNFMQSVLPSYQRNQGCHMIWYSEEHFVKDDVFKIQIMCWFIFYTRFRMSNWSRFLWFHIFGIFDFRFNPSWNERVESVLRYRAHGRADGIKVLFGQSVDYIVDVLTCFWDSKDGCLISKMNYWS